MKPSLPPAGGHREATYRPGGAPAVLPWPVALLVLAVWLLYRLVGCLPEDGDAVSAAAFSAPFSVVIAEILVRPRHRPWARQC